VSATAPVKVCSVCVPHCVYVYVCVCVCVCVCGVLDHQDCGGVRSKCVLCVCVCVRVTVC